MILRPGSLVRSTMEHLTMALFLVILVGAIKAYTLALANMDIMICPHNTPKCPSLQNSNGDVIPLFLKYVTKQDGGMLTPAHINHRLTINLQCTVPGCLSSPCMNRGRCSEDLNGFICDCEGDYGGHTCQRMRPTCQEVTCSNGGTCHDDPTIGFYCLCKPCHYGVFCEQDYDKYYEGQFSVTSYEPIYTFEPLAYEVTVNGTFYLDLSQVVSSGSCDIRKSNIGIAWFIATPNGTVPVITIYHFDTFDEFDGAEYFFVANTPPLEDGNITSEQDLRIGRNLIKRYKDVGLWVPEVLADPEKQNALLYAQGSNLSSVLPYTVRARSNHMFCRFYSYLINMDIERYTSVVAKVRAVFPDQL